MTPERAYGLALKIASETYDQIIALGDDPAPEQAAEIVLEAAKRLGCTDADAPALIAAWPRVMARVDELQRRVVDQETEKARVGIGHVIRRGRALQ
jgi:hypothetical protein